MSVQPIHKYYADVDRIKRAEKFNTYRFADHKEHVIELLMRVCAVSVETMKIVKEMPDM